MAALTWRRADTLALAAIAALAIGLRMAAILIAPTLNWADEIFQATEQAHRLVYGSGLVPWEFQLGARSWLLPGVIAAVMQAVRLIGDGPDIYLPTIAAVFGGLAAASVACGFLWGRRCFGLTGGVVAATTVAVAPELVFLGARTLAEVVAGNVLLVALLVFDRAVSRRALLASGALFGLVVVLRFQLAPTLLPVAVAAAWRGGTPRLAMLAAAGVVPLALAAAFDAVTLGAPSASIWRNAVYNIGYGVADSFGVEPAAYYALAELSLWGGGLIVLLALVGIGARRQPLLLAVAALILVEHSAIAHKEYRFVYPAMVLLAVLAGLGLAELTSWSTGLLVRRGVSGVRAGPLCAGLGLLYWSFLCWQTWTSPTFAVLRDHADADLLAARFVARLPTVCGIGLYGRGSDAWVNGGYTYFQHAVPLYWPQGATALAASAPAFDTLVASQPPPDTIGFVRGACFADVCVLRRPGPCTSLPMTPLPLPKGLVR